MDGYDESTYGDRFADVYDDWYGDITDTDACVERLATAAHEAAGPDRAPVVLELGVGTGRLALPLAERGLLISGLDASESMLAALRAKDPDASVSPVHGDMAEPPFGQGIFDLVFVVYNTFFNLTTERAQQRCLDAVGRMLRPHGRFVLEAFVPDMDGDVDAVTPREMAADRVVLSVVRSRPQRRELIGQYIDITEAGIALRPWHIRWATPAQLDEAAGAAGLELLDRRADWHGNPHTSSSATHVSTFGRR